MHTSQTSSKLLEQVNIQHNASPTFQIAERMRGMILEGAMAPGMKLPPTRQLAEQLSVDPSAAHRALANLVKEGLLVRTPRVGTFVAQPPKKLERLAYYHRSMVSGYFSPFEAAILNQATQIAQREGFVMEVFSDTRDTQISAVEPHPDLLREARTRRVQAVISGSVSPVAVKWYNSLPIPQCTLSTPEAPHTIGWDAEQIMALGIEQLYRRGSRKIAVITPRRNRPDPNATSYEMRTYNGTLRTLARLGLQARPEWIIGPEPLGKSIYEQGMAEFGYNSMNTLWNLKERPDGVMIYPDIAVQGVLLAVARLGIRVPEELHLVIHTNEEVPLFCPYPVDRVLTRAQEAANALIRYVRQRIDHGTPVRESLNSYLLTY